MQTTRVTSSEFQQAFGALSDKARNEPVVITKHGRDSLVVMAAEEQERLRRRDRRVGLTTEAPDELIEAVRAAKVPDEFEYLDAELKQDRVPLPPPVPGLVLRYSYLWYREHVQGREEGLKDRPCAIVAAVRKDDAGDMRVLVLPITHTAPTTTAWRSNCHPSSSDASGSTRRPPGS